MCDFQRCVKKLHWFAYEDERSLRLARLLAQHDVVKAKIYLSWCYLNGRLLGKNFELALRWAIDAAKGKDGEALHYLAWVLLHGPGQPYIKKAAEKLQEAASIAYQPAIKDMDLLQNDLLGSLATLWSGSTRLHADLNLSRFYAIAAKPFIPERPGL